MLETGWIVYQGSWRWEQEVRRASSIVPPPAPPVLDGISRSGPPCLLDKGAPGSVTGAELSARRVRSIVLRTL